VVVAPPLDPGSEIILPAYSPVFAELGLDSDAVGEGQSIDMTVVLRLVQDPKVWVYIQ